MNKKTKCRISIALATYNGEKYLLEQLNSFASQIRVPDELVICDDNSVDDTVEIARAFSGTAPFEVIIIKNEKNIGYPQNFSKALSFCSGDFVFLSDQDDVWCPEKISKVLSRFNFDRSVQLVIHDISYCKEDLSPVGQTKLGRMTGVFDIYNNYVVGMATAIRTPFLKLCLPVPDDPGMGHDDWLHQCAVAVNGKEVFPEVLAMHRRHRFNATFSNPLNVDFITTPEHFGADKKFLKRLREESRLFREKRVLGEPELSPLTLWLKDNKESLVDHGYSSKSHIESLVSEDEIRVSSVHERLRIISMKRFERVVPVIVSYLRGQYRFFDGWKSAFKDLLVR